MEVSPLTLEEICVDKYVAMLEPFIGCQNVDEMPACLKSLSKIWWRDRGYFFTEFLVNLLLRKCKKKNRCTDLLLHLFSDKKSCKFTRADLSNTSVTDVGLLYLKDQPLTYLNVTSCYNISMSTLINFLTSQPNLLELRMMHLQHLRPSIAWPDCLVELKKLRLVDVSYCVNIEMWAPSVFSCLTAVTHLSIRAYRGPEVDKPNFLHLYGMEAMRNLTFLDISGHQIHDLSPIAKLSRTLKILIMYNCIYDMSHAMEDIRQLSNLQRLDLSKDGYPHQTQVGTQSWAVTENELKILSKLEDLTDLDISAVAMLEGDFPFDCLGKKEKQLKFLGLVGTPCCLCENIPAQVVAGSANMEQVLALFERYSDGTRQQYVEEGIIALAQGIDIGGDDTVRAIQGLTKVLEAYKRHTHTVDLGCNLLYHLTSNEDANITPLMRRDLLELVVSTMEYHTFFSVTRSCCFLLYNLKLPNDMDRYLERIIKVLVEMTNIDQSHDSRRISVTLLNSCICHITLAQKSKLGFQVIQAMLEAIRVELENKRVGLVLNNAWSTLWNITDETPTNSQIFIENGGLRLFYECFSSHYQELDLMRTILGMIGNVVEVTDLHSHLLKEDIVGPIYDLLFKEQSDLETRYNVCGILCNLAGTDGDGWTFSHPTREDALRRVEHEVGTWDVSSRRQMSYISFKPLLRLLGNSYPFQSHYWVVWALSNFCHCDGSGPSSEIILFVSDDGPDPETSTTKYGQMLVNEGGIAILENMVQSPTVDARIRELAQNVLSVSLPLVNVSLRN